MYRLVITAILSASTIYAVTDKNYRLNTPILPSAYHLHITPYFDTHDEKSFTFDGEVSINFTTAANTKQIKLHSNLLNFTASNVTVTNLNTSKTMCLSPNNPLEFNSKYSFVYFNLLNELVPNVQYDVRIIYAGHLREGSQGFSMSYYIENGVKRWMATTHMQPVHARKVFPCFDEPGLKAIFTVQIDRPSNYKNSLSNTKLKTSVDLGNGYTRDTFYSTPRMSTYLVAFVVSEMEQGEYRNGSRMFSVYARPQAKKQTSYAFDLGQKIVDQLSVYFGIDYYSTNKNMKLDQVALPDSVSIAMENWGLITYRENFLLYDPLTTGPSYRNYIATTLTHEITHMWFGNLVTCHWWSDTWLQEGVATYFENYFTALIEPELGSANSMVTNSMYAAYRTDDSRSVKPLSNDNVDSDIEIEINFGTITYKKGSSVLRMIHHLIGDNAFKLGLHVYLVNNSFGSVYPDQLYAALDHGASVYNSMKIYSNLSVADVMGSWVTQAGHPLLQVNIDYITGTVELSQKRFYSNALHSSDEIYKIPITYTTGISPNFNDTKPVFIMDTTSYNFTIFNISQLQTWVIFNVQETGFYRIKYDEKSWKIIETDLKGNDYKTIHHLNRAKIVNDLFALFDAEEIKFVILHDILEFLLQEDNYSVWVAALKGLQNLMNRFILNADVFADIEVYMLGLINHVINRIGYKERVFIDSFEDLRNRLQILEFACYLGHSGCIQNTVAMFRDLKENGTEVHPSLRPVVYSTGLRFGNADDYDFLWNRMLTTNVANEAAIILNALGSTSDEEKLKSFLLPITKENSPIRTQDIYKPLITVLKNHSNFHIVIESLKCNYTEWTSVYKDMLFVLVNLAAREKTEIDLKNFEAFLSNCTQCENSDKSLAKKVLRLAVSDEYKIWVNKQAEDILSTLRKDRREESKSSR